VYDQHVWWSDEWDALEYGRDFDFSRPFFEQYADLARAVPRLSIINSQSENSDYCNYSRSNQHCFLCFGGHENENCSYCWYNWQDKDCFDCLSVIKSELTYESNVGGGLYRSGYLEYSFDSSDCWFGYNLQGCRHCFLSSNLRNKEYYFHNEPLSKEEYERRVIEFWKTRHEGLERAKREFAALKLTTIRRPVYQKSTEDCRGDDIVLSKSIRHGFDGEYSEDSAYVYPKFTNVYHCQDTNKMGYERSEWTYMAIGCAGLNNARFCDSCWTGSNLTYTTLCFSSRDLFGCVGLRNKQYCIFNKQYSKEEYEALVLKIIEHMKQTGEWGQFFPKELSPFAYNETTAQEYTPLDQASAEALGYRWRKPDRAARSVTLQSDQLPEIGATTDDILSEVIGCPHAGTCSCQCSGTQSENGVYHNQTASHSSHTEAQACPNTFETSFAPNRPEIVYCESCYQAEVL